MALTHNTAQYANNRVENSHHIHADKNVKCRSTNHHDKRSDFLNFMVGWVIYFDMVTISSMQFITACFGIELSPSGKR